MKSGEITKWPWKQWLTLEHVVKHLTIELLEIPVMKGSEIRVSYEIVVIKVVLDDCKQILP